MRLILGALQHKSRSMIKNKDNKKTTSVKIDIDLWKQLKIYCIRKNIEIGYFIEEMIRKELNKR